VPPKPVLHLTFFNARELEQPCLLQRVEDGQSGSAHPVHLDLDKQRVPAQASVVLVEVPGADRPVAHLAQLNPAPHVGSADDGAHRTQRSESEAGGLIHYQVPHKPDEPLRMLQLNTKFKTVFPASQLESVIHYFQMETVLRNALAIRDRSCLTILRMNYVDLHTATLQPLPGRCYKPLPRYLMAKKELVIGQNGDNRCFGFTLLAALHPSAT